MEKTADWIWMSFGVVSGVGREMGVIDGIHVPQREWDVSGRGVQHAAGEFIFCGDGWRRGCSKMTSGITCYKLTHQRSNRRRRRKYARRFMRKSNFIIFLFCRSSAIYIVYEVECALHSHIYSWITGKRKANAVSFNVMNITSL